MKKLLFLLLLALPLLLTACGGGGSSTTTANNPGNTTAVPSPTPTPGAHPSLIGSYVLHDIQIAYDNGNTVHGDEMDALGAMEIDATTITEQITTDNVSFETTYGYTIQWTGNTAGVLNVLNSDGSTMDVHFQYSTTGDTLTCTYQGTDGNLSFTETDGWQIQQTPPEQKLQKRTHGGFVAIGSYLY